MAKAESLRKAESFLSTLRNQDKKGHEGRILNHKGNYYCCSECPSNFAPGAVEELLARFLEANTRG